jgi:hypothetical protein
MFRLGLWRRFGLRRAMLRMVRWLLLGGRCGRGLVLLVARMLIWRMLAKGGAGAKRAERGRRQKCGFQTHSP